MGKSPDSYEVNLLKPKRGYMRSEVRVILAVLAGWGGMTFGFQFLLRFLAEDPRGESFLTRLTFFNLPAHFWFTAQFLPLWFIILCALFNVYIDRLTMDHSRRKDRSYE